MLLISDQEVRQVLTVPDRIDAMERGFAEEARGIAVNRPRSRPFPDIAKPMRRQVVELAWTAVGAIAICEVCTFNSPFDCRHGTTP
jgi:hypothetical protein